jgi:hypothetical protein
VDEANDKYYFQVQVRNNFCHITFRIFSKVLKGSFSFGGPVSRGDIAVIFCKDIFFSYDFKMILMCPGIRGKYIKNRYLQTMS